MINPIEFKANERTIASLLYKNVDENHKKSLTHKKLQKLIYYVYSWALAFDLEDEIENIEFQAWVHGPVISNLYNELCVYGYNAIPDSHFENEEAVKESNLEALINTVLSVYGSFSAGQLESLTHKEEPWLEARSGLGEFESSNNIIDDVTIKRYYKQKLVENNAE